MLVAGDKRRSVRNIMIKPISYFNSLCARVDNSRDACLVALLYLSGRRIGELPHLTLNDFEASPDFIVFKTFNEKVFRKKPIGDYKFLHGGRYYEVIYPRFSLKSESGRMLGSYVLSHLETLEEGECLFYSFRNRDKTKHIGVNRMYKIVRELDPDVWLHWFRHQRFTMIARAFKDSPLAMHQFTKHKRFESTLKYIHLVELEERLNEI